MATVVVLGGNFAGCTSALEVRRHLRKLDPDGAHEVIVVSRSEDFLFVPSLTWVPFQEREIADISFPVGPVLEAHGVQFVHDTAERVDLAEQVVTTAAGQRLPYDFLVVATGPKLDWSIPGLGPSGFTSCICTPPDALAARTAFERLVDEPGPVVVGATQRAGCIGAAYEFLLNLEFQLRQHGVRDRVELTWVTPEPFLGHFGIGGLPHAQGLMERFFEHLGIRWRTGVAIDHAEEGTMVLGDGSHLEFAFAMIVPPFVGQDVVAASPGLGNAHALVPVRDTYQHREHPNVFGAGVAIDVPSPFSTPVAVGVPKTGYPADVEGKVVGENIARLVASRVDLRERPFSQIPGLCVLDAGHKEVVIVANHLFPPRDHALLIPNPLYDEGKRLFERYYLWKARHGYSWLP
ncbi:NAD(P)/FAD-dependent oxidoreductase [Aciditerrimonas ferrireducens]|jgi:sulfide:quinone oxidoreductase|uniref:NAD(P)/FAD-dependent oxidoreductase n=1 Tax=Aciditerrimonas ferrireducens TaxID=667306 RepID=A0ABV6C3I3_9ACTN